MTNPFVGRRHEASELRRIAESANRNGTSAALVTGEAGSGKTRLIEHAFKALPAYVVRIRPAGETLNAPAIDLLEQLTGGAFSLDGVAKLESEANLGLLWNEGGTQSVSVALFSTGRGVGCRGFLQEGGKTRTWEILFQLKQQVVGGDNVVTLRRR